MSGRRIDDHTFWAGRPGKDTVFPDGPHKTKGERSAEGAGHLGTEYPDTTEDIHRDQDAGIKKAEGRKIKPGYRY